MSRHNALQGIETSWLGEAHARPKGRKLTEERKRAREKGVEAEGAPGEEPPLPRFTDPVMFANPQDLLENNGESSANARSALDRARAVVDFPCLGEAVKNGELPTGFIDVLKARISKVPEVRAYLTKHPDEELRLLDLTKQSITPEVFGKALRAWAIKNMPVTMEKQATRTSQASTLNFFPNRGGKGWKISGTFDDIDGHHINAWFNRITGRTAKDDHRTLPQRRAAAFTTAILNGGALFELCSPERAQCSTPNGLASSIRTTKRMRCSHATAAAPSPVAPTLTRPATSIMRRSVRPAMGTPI